MSDEPPIDPIPPDPPPTLSPPPKDPAVELTKLINALDRDNEGERSAAAGRIHSLLRHLKQNFAESYKVVERDGTPSDDYWRDTYWRRYSDKTAHVYQQNLELANQAERLRAEIQMLRKHVSDNSYRNIYTQAANNTHP
jgi:hypothetical protein